MQPIGHENQNLIVLAAAAAPELPADPARFIVLAIGVVVAVLRAAELIPRSQHRDAEREEKRRDEVAFLAKAQSKDRRIDGHALLAAIPAEIVAAAVGVLFAIGPIVLLGIADHVLERESVMRGDEIDAG